MYQQFPIVAQRDGKSLKEVLKCADFFAYYGIFEHIANRWVDRKTFHYRAIRLKGVIFIGNTEKYDAKFAEKGKSAERKIRNATGNVEATDLQAKHYRVTSSKLQWNDETHLSSLNLASIVEIDSFENGEAVEIKTCSDSKSQILKKYRHRWANWNLASSIRMSLGGIEKMKQVYGNGKAEMLPWAKLLWRRMNFKNEKELANRAIFSWRLFFSFRVI
ncbi:hypothetical protein PENTCL1PPCAC_12256 [Pristionchus entomophagus]|uniref:Decapping nuclease n=1 Tax=Pristionchus entomophagus TaxID=358040 RepID=A0AAV5TE93_9BILA|nr:hypothetical protein PENTCL1PPCAC_12256 [Pristionchus entomophagus]